MRGSTLATSARAAAVTPVPDWDSRLPWLRAGTTRANGPPQPDGFLAEGWRSVARSRQAHGTQCVLHGGPGGAAAAPGAIAAPDADGHLTRAPGLLLTVTLADCVPVFLADPARRAVALLHAGWRGTAAGVVGSGVAAMRGAFGTVPGDLFAHLGPAICGDCYEVGPEVFAALGEPAPPGPAPVDLRGVLRRRVMAAGVGADRLTVSGECTLCGGGRYFSHRRGDEGRHLGFIGILPKSGAARPSCGAAPR